MFDGAIEAVFPRCRKLQTTAKDGKRFRRRGFEVFRDQPVRQHDRGTGFIAAHRVPHGLQGDLDFGARFVAAAGPIIHPVEGDVGGLQPVVNRRGKDGPGHAPMRAGQYLLQCPAL